MQADISSTITEELAKKILSSQKVALEYLAELGKAKSDSRIVGVLKSKKDIWGAVVATWDYAVSTKIIREMFKAGPKYARAQSAPARLAALQKDWEASGLGPITWPCSQGKFDDLAQNINSQPSLTDPNKDEQIAEAAIRYRRIKEMNTLRHDYIEASIIDRNPQVLPTLSHERDADFFVDGIVYDQKVSKSPTKQFKEDHAPDWKLVAQKRPELVAEYLYTHQDEVRFGYDPRLLVVCLDENVSPQRIKDIIDRTPLTKPLHIRFTYKHKMGGPKIYETDCFVILLGNQ